MPEADQRILRLTRPEEKRLLERLARITSLADLRNMQCRLQEQLGIVLTVSAATAQVRTLRGISVWVQEQPGLCRKTRKSMTSALRQSLAQSPDIVFELLNENGLFAGD